MASPNATPTMDEEERDGNGTGGKILAEDESNNDDGQSKSHHLDNDTRQTEELDPLLGGGRSTTSNGDKATLRRSSISTSLRSFRPSFSAGASRKASPTTLHSWVKLSLTLDGRDKITKVLQYSARMMAWWCQSRHFRTEHALRFRALQASLTKSRKAYRIGRSVVEVEKIRQVGVLALMKWYLQRSVRGSGHDEPSPVQAPAWKVFGAALKMFGLFGFWAGDNMSFITSTGFLDNYSLPLEDRLARRQAAVSRASKFASRSYFLGCVAGLVTSARSYWTFHQSELKPCQEEVDRKLDAKNQNVEETQKKLRMLKQKQFDLFVPFLKSCCDVLVFSNNPGVDLHKRFRGRKMHEGFHCLCGLLSATSVLYMNYPDADP